MTVLAQHGWGKSTKIERGLQAGTIQGVIMSPRDESPRKLVSFLTELQEANPEAELLVDPQFHIGAIQGLAAVGHLSEYDHYRSRLNPSSFNPRTTTSFVQDVLEWQNELDVTAILSPTVMVNDLDGQWAQVASMLAQETIDQHNGDKPLLISLVVEEDALRQRGQVDEWLDDLTGLEADGFYIVVRRRDESYRQNYDPVVLTSLLRVCYSLAEVNEYRVFAGYTDMASLLLHAVGVEGTGSGWSAGLRQFILRRFRGDRGGRQPRPRYSSGPLLNSIYIYELDAIYNGGLVEEVLSGSPLDRRFNDTRNPEDVDWSPEESALHHWYVLNDIVESLAGDTLEARLDSAGDSVALALATYAQIRPVVGFSPGTGSQHLQDWQEALQNFRS